MTATEFTSLPTHNLARTMGTDRNLLFGVLAFQDEYIDLAQLAAICRAWAAAPSVA